MGKKAVLVIVLASCLAFAPLEWAPLHSVRGHVSISVGLGVGIGDIIDAILDAVGQLIDK